MPLEDEKQTYFKFFWLPVGILVLEYPVLMLLFGPGPWWGVGYLAALIALLVMIGSGILLLWGALLIGWGIRVGAKVRSLVLATAVGGLPFLFGVAIFLYFYPQR
jgi:hypothetical protein